MKFDKINDEDFDSYYVLKIINDYGDRYFFSSRLFVQDIGLARKFNTIRSIKRCIKICSIEHYQIEKLSREN